jgi:ATP-dependent helicase HrpB
LLPIEAVLPQIRQALSDRLNAVVIAPPGAGKTTGVPLALLDEPWAQGRKLILLSPRRLAARAAAQRMASLLGEPLGRTIGYRVRLDTKVSAETRIEVVTEGVFTRQILAAPDLPDVAAVLFDECHERSLEGDLGLALALDAQGGFCESLRIMAMSATVDGSRFATLMGDAPVIESQGRLHPIESRYQDRDPALRIEQQMARVILQALSQETGSILGFLPGAAEIERTASLLQEAIGDPAIHVHRLYGARDAADQSAAIAPCPPGQRKIVLATSIAETSLTIDGVRVVIDSGLTRRPVYEPATGLSRLETGRVSRASADQRQGRAGRLEPGVCIRLWAEQQTRGLVAFDPPEITQADLTGLALTLAQWGVVDPLKLRWLDPPPAGAWKQATTLLTQLNALTEAGRITPHGQKLAALPLPPHLAHMVLGAVPLERGMTAALLAGLIGERGLGGADPDARTRLETLLRDGAPRARALRSQAERWARQAGGQTDKVSPEKAGFCLALAYPDRIAQARPGQRGQFLLANGRGCRLDPGHPLAGADYVVVADLAGAAEQARVLLAAPITEKDLRTCAADRIVEEIATAFDPAHGTIRATMIERLGALRLSQRPQPRLPQDALAAGLVQAVQELGVAIIPAWTEMADFLARVTFLHGLAGEHWPGLSNSDLQDFADQWLPAALGSCDRLGQITGHALQRALMLLLPADAARLLDTLAPERLTTPAGASHRIDYGAEGGPAVEVRVQEVFGLTRHPMVGGGKVPLVLRLLSPGHKPVQTTRDLPGFWAGSYAAVRAELRGRYPKHPWPDDPANALPTTRAKPRGT